MTAGTERLASGTVVATINERILLSRHFRLVSNTDGHNLLSILRTSHTIENTVLKIYESEKRKVREVKLPRKLRTTMSRKLKSDICEKMKGRVTCGHLATNTSNRQTDRHKNKYNSQKLGIPTCAHLLKLHRSGSQ